MTTLPTSLSNLNLTTFNKIYPLLVQKYSTLVPDPNANTLDKINSMIDSLNSVGKLSNDVVDNWNKVMAWVMNDGLTTDVSNKLDAMVTAGTFDTIFQKDIAPSLGDITQLQTTDKSNLTNALNEVDQLAKSNQTNVGTLSNLQTTHKTDLVSAVNDNVASLADIAIDVKLAPYNAKSDKSADASGAIQQACDYVAANGGGVVKIPKGTYLFLYPVFVKSNTTVIGDGVATHIVANISLLEGRCAFVIGDSYEWNRAKTDQNRAAGIRGTIENSSFTDISLGYGMTMEGTDSAIQASNSNVQNLFIEFDYTNCGTNWGGYGVQINHAYQCYIKDIWTKNACQAFGMGSDVPPSTPGNVDCWAENIHVISPDVNHTYYAVGFIANSNRCGVRNADSPVAMTQNSSDGTLYAKAYVNQGWAYNINGVVGRTQTSEGILLNNCRGCIVDKFFIKNALKGIATSYSSSNSQIDSTKPNKIKNGFTEDVDNTLSLQSKYDYFENITNENAINDVVFDNINATNNVIHNCNNKVVVPPSGQANNWSYVNNKVGKYKSNDKNRLLYFQFANFLAPLQTNGISSFGTNSVVLNGNQDVTFYIPLNLLGADSIEGITFYATFGSGSKTKGSSITTTVYRRNDFTGNSGAAMTQVAQLVTTPPDDNVDDVTCDLYVMGERENDVGEELLVVVVFHAPTANSTVKNGRISVYQ